MAPIDEAVAHVADGSPTKLDELRKRAEQRGYGRGAALAFAGLLSPASPALLKTPGAERSWAALDEAARSLADDAFAAAVEPEETPPAVREAPAPSPPIATATAMSMAITRPMASITRSRARPVRRRRLRRPRARENAADPLVCSGAATSPRPFASRFPDPLPADRCSAAVHRSRSARCRAGRQVERRGRNPRAGRGQVQEFLRPTRLLADLGRSGPDRATGRCAVGADRG